MVYKESRDRTLRDELPELQKYLKPGLSVLDVGCGHGSISLDVAQAIQPGKLVGIDISKENVDISTALAEERQVSNVDFKIMDAHKLDFDDNTYDLVYSYTVAHFWIDPIQVMRELKRVAKPGAWVVTAGIRDSGFIPHYPKCPMYIKVWEGISAKMEADREQIISGTFDPKGVWDFFMDFYAGRKCVEWSVDAGFDDLEISTRIEDWWYPGSAGKDSFFFQTSHLDHEYNDFQMDIAIKAGYLDRETVNKAKEEMKQWERNPHAFYFNPLITISGRA